jgi:hypothetical protein
MSAGGDAGRDTKTGRFQKGVSGNRKGRPKKAPTVGAAILGALREKVPIKENGRSKRVTKLEATAKQMANRSASGDPRASKLALDLAQKAEERLAAAPATAAELNASDAEIVERLIERFRQIIKEEDHGPDHAR